MFNFKEVRWLSVILTLIITVAVMAAGSSLIYMNIIVPDFSEKFQNNAYSFYDAGDYDKAIIELEKALALDNDNPELILAVTDCYIEVGRYADAEVMIERLEGMGKDVSEIAGKLAEHYINNDKLDDAERLAEKIKNLDDLKIRILKLLAESYLNAFRYADAERIFDILLGLGVKESTLVISLTDGYIGETQYSDAERMLDKFDDVNEDNSNYVLTLAEAYIGAKLYDDAIRVLENLSDFNDGFDTERFANMLINLNVYNPNVAYQMLMKYTDIKGRENLEPEILELVEGSELPPAVATPVPSSGTYSKAFIMTSPVDSTRIGHGVYYTVAGSDTPVMFNGEYCVEESMVISLLGFSQTETAEVVTVTYVLNGEIYNNALWYVGECKKILEEAVEGTNVGNYIPGSKAEFSTAITSAETALEANLITDEEVTAIYNNMQYAHNLFLSKIIPDTDKTTLVTTINNARNTYNNSVEGEKNGNYPRAARQELLTAINAAVAVNDNLLSTQEQINNAVTTLKNAVTTFNSKKVVINKNTLNNSIQSCISYHNAAVEGTQPGQYNYGAKSTYMNAIIAAQAVYNDPNVTQTQVNNAVTVLNQATTTFDSNKVPISNKTSLYNTIQHATTVYNNNKNRTTVAYSVHTAFYNEISIAQSVYNNNNATQTQVDSAKSTLDTKIAQYLVDIEGGETGKLNFRIFWDNYDDVDLHVTLPNGQEIYYGNRYESGGSLDVDANAGNKTNTPVENITWENNPPSGTYRVRINLYSDDSSSSSANVTFSVIVNDVVYDRKYITLDRNGTREVTYTYSF